MVRILYLILYLSLQESRLRLPLPTPKAEMIALRIRIVQGLNLVSHLSELVFKNIKIISHCDYSGVVSRVNSSSMTIVNL